MALVPSTRGGGTERQAMQRYLRYRKWGIKVDLVVLDEEGPLSYNYRNSGVSIYSRKPAITRVVGQVLTSKYDLIETYGFRAHTIGRVLGRMLTPRSKMVSTKTSVDLNWSVIQAKIERITSPLVSVYVSNSYATKRALQRIGIREEKIRVIPNGLDLSRFYRGSARELVRKRVRSLLNIRGDSYVVLCVANLRPVKAHYALVQAINSLISDDFRVTLLIAGDGTERANAENLVRNLAIDSNVLFLGWRNDVPDLLAASDVFVLASLWEGMPSSVMEAMAAEVPVVASAVGGIPEIIKSGQSGILVRPACSDDLVVALKYLWLNKGKTEEIVANAANEVAGYSMARHVDNWISLYQSMNLL